MGGQGCKIHLWQLASIPDQTLPENKEELNSQICCTLQLTLLSHTLGERETEDKLYCPVFISVSWMVDCHMSPRPTIIWVGSETEVVVFEQWCHPRQDTGGCTEVDRLHITLVKETFSINRISCPEVHQCLFITQFFVVKILLYKSVSHCWGWMTSYIAYCTDIFCSFCVLL